MRCLSTEELIRLAVHPGAPEEWRAHVRECARCSECSQTIAGLCRQTAEAHHVFEERHDQGRARLMTA